MHLDLFTALRITLASPEQILSWSSGEVTEPKTINYLTGQPEPDGLFSEQIFGPVKDWHCACGKYRRKRIPGFVCDQCGVEITRRFVRRERMGHIELAAPVVHPWFAHQTQSPLAVMLGISPKTLHALLFYEAYLVLDIRERERARLLSVPPDQEDTQRASLFALLGTLSIGDVLATPVKVALSSPFGEAFRAGTGAQAIRERLQALDLSTLAKELRDQIEKSEKPAEPALKRLQVVEAFRTSGVHPSWMILSVLPVLPPELRPLVPIDGGRFATTDLNTLYERVLHRNNRIKHLFLSGAPEVILNNERRLLQQTCDALFDNGHQLHPVVGHRRQPLKSLTDLLSGKHGRFRYNLLGKRVDYSGRSVIVGDPTLRLDQCGLPTSICLELFKPFLIRKLLERNVAESPRAGKRMIERSQRTSILWDLLEEVMHEKLVLLNRAPTLHRLSIQAFEARRVEGSAIRLHPLVCSAFNADFDGDQMAVHLPLSNKAQQEARELLFSTRNLRNSQSGEPSINISQEMVLGLFYLTQNRPSPHPSGRLFADADEAVLALSHGVIDLHTPLVVRLARSLIFDTPDGEGVPVPESKRIETTVGRLLFNAILPEALRYRNYEMTKETLGSLIAECLERLGSQITAQLADDLKQLGFRYATKSGISFALSDMKVPSEKNTLLAQADKEAEALEEQYRTGTINQQERSHLLIALWTQATEAISTQLETSLDPYGSLSTIIKSGATKARFQQIRQLAGMRGLMARPSGEIIDIPIRGNYLEGLTVRESFLAASAARNGFMGRSLNTATTGYLTRRLVEAGMEVWITQEDCGTSDGFLITNQQSQQAGLSDMHSRILGRILAEPVAELKVGTLIDRNKADHLLASGIQAVRVRSVLHCQAPYGVCRRCYGADLSTGQLVGLGTAVGIIAGQSIGEPGTQLSMKAFHSGGIANAQGDIRGGLPRVIDLFEVRTGGACAPLAHKSGRVEVARDAKGGTTTIQIFAPGEEGEESWHCVLPLLQQPSVQSGQWIETGTPLFDGAIDLRELLGLVGREAVAHYLIAEVQRVFRSTGVIIHDKHLECIIRQMLRYIQVGHPGDTRLLPGEIIDSFRFGPINLEIWAQGGHPAIAQPVVLGLTRAVLQTSSWLAAASFQQTSRVLRDAAIRGKSDPLLGFKERVITGLRLPSHDEHKNPLRLPKMKEEGSISTEDRSR